MKVFLTGATGFLGSNVLRALLREGHAVAATLRETSDMERIANLEGQYTGISMNAWKDGISHFMPEVVVHCATSYGRGNANTEEVFSSNLVFPMMLLESTIACGCRYFVNTDSFFCKQLPDRIEKGERLYMPDYTLSKYQFSEWGRLRAIEDKICFINLCMEHIYGPGDRVDKFVPWLETQLKENVPQIDLTLGTQERDFVRVEDAAEAYIKVLNDLPKYSGYRHFEVGTGESRTLRSFVEQRKEELKSTSTLNFGAIEMKPEEILFSVASSTSPYLISKFGF